MWILHPVNWDQILWWADGWESMRAEGPQQACGATGTTSPGMDGTRCSKPNVSLSLLYAVLAATVTETVLKHLKL